MKLESVGFGGKRLESTRRSRWQLHLSHWQLADSIHRVGTGRTTGKQPKNLFLGLARDLVQELEVVRGRDVISYLRQRSQMNPAPLEHLENDGILSGDARGLNTVMRFILAEAQVLLTVRKQGPTFATVQATP